MAKDITFGQYYPAESVIHRLDPRAKLIFVVAYIVAVFLCKTFYAYLAVLIFVLITIFISKIPLKNVLKTMKGILFLVIFTAILNVFFFNDGKVLFTILGLKITQDGLLFSAKMASRLLLLVIGTSILTLTTTPISLTDGLESLMKPLKYIKFPVHDVAIIMSTALRFIPSLMDEIDRIMMAQKARGASFDTGGLIKRAKALLPVLIPLFVSAFTRADELALALDARCYNATPNRTKMKILKYQLRDLFSAIAVAILITLVVAVDAGFWGLF